MKLKGKTYEEVFGVEVARVMKEKMRLAKLGKKRPNRSKSHIEKQSGKNHWNWKGGKSSEKHLLRGQIQWKNWRNLIFERDNYTCQECGKKKCYLEPHHIIPIREDKTKLFEINNGITLCRPCHQKTIWKESDYEEKYLKIIAAQV